MLNKEQILRKKIRTDASCNVSVNWQLQQDYLSVTKKARQFYSRSRNILPTAGVKGF